MKYRPETIGDAILAHVKTNHGTQAKAAAAFGCGTTFLNQVVKGERRPNKAMLEAIGYQHLEVWMPTDCPWPNGALPLRNDQQEQAR